MTINRASTIAMLTLSLAAALLVVVSASLALARGQPPGPPHDEGTAAHVFQLLIAALVPTTMLFVASADWQMPLRAARPLAVAGAFIVVAFAALYYFEKVLGY